MIYLLLKMFVYLVLAAGIGAAAGWLYRNLQAQSTEEDAQRAVNDARAKVPRLESLIRSRDEQAAKVKQQYVEAANALKHREEDVRELTSRLQVAERKAREIERREHKDGKLSELAGETVMQSGEAATGPQTELQAELRVEIEALKSALAEAQHNTPAVDEDALIKAEHRWKSAESQLQTALADLAAERRKTAELERERELHKKSLKLLSQQLQDGPSQSANSG